MASYKFALAKTLLDLKPTSGHLISMSDLAPLFSKHVSDHLKLSDKQGTSSSSRFLNACRDFNAGALTEDDLIEQTVRHGFNNVIDAFHTVGRGVVPRRFFVDERKKNDGIRVTDEFAELLEHEQAVNLPVEVEARWRLVETAWDLGVPRSILPISYDSNEQSLFAIDHLKRRRSITGSRDALNGYQKGQCFYCYSAIHIDGGESHPDVDHFFPHALKQREFDANIDGVWNLVLACKECNRGQGGKFDRVPTPLLLERLHRRNEFLITSHHPLREILLLQTGQTSDQRIAFLQAAHTRARASLIHLWEPEEKADPLF